MQEDNNQTDTFFKWTIGLFNFKQINSLEGIVTKSTGKWYIVKLSDGKSMDCRIKGKFRFIP